MFLVREATRLHRHSKTAVPSHDSVSEAPATSDREIDMVREIVRCLNVIQLGAETLCRGDTGLLEAEAALKFVLSSLKKEGGQLANRFYDALTLRIRHRRSEAAAVLQILHNLPQNASKRGRK